MRVAAASTRLLVKLTALVPNASGAGTRRMTIGTLGKKVSAGTVSAARQAHCEGRGAPERAHEDDLTVTLTGSSAGAKRASLKSSLIVRS